MHKKKKSIDKNVNEHIQNMTNNSAFSQCEIAPLIHNTNKNDLLLICFSSIHRHNNIKEHTSLTQRNLSLIALIVSQSLKHEDFLDFSQ